ncbi:MAG TPA: ribonuclease HII [Acidimicrobiales bacterium]|nr:ribonuclease HII [Acidimicrobiales bacterium]
MTAALKGDDHNGPRISGDPADAAEVTATAPAATAVRPKAQAPRLVRERRLLRKGHGLVAGVDEVGRGAWAGPLSVGVAVIEASRRRVPAGLRDSKQLPEDTREAMFERVGRWCAAWAVGHVSAEECDRFGMTRALRVATQRAFAALPDEARPDAVVLDGNFDYVSPPKVATLFDEDDSRVCDPAVETVIGADALCASVAAASVLAKVTRDRIMRGLADSFPPFDFDRNKGYPSPVHKRALAGYGLSAIHRRSWVFADHLPWVAQRVVRPGVAPGAD